jgi:catechol 2,3-dioxygenase-like lactoylglutathione lyase family enzyme
MLMSFLLMLVALRNKMIARVFEVRAASIRLRRSLGLLGRLNVGVLDHITIPVHDLDRAREFYCGVLGAAYAMTVDDETFRRFGRPPAPNGGEGSHHISVYFSGTTRVDLFLQRSGQPAPAAGHPHFAFRVSPGQILRWKDRLAAHGVPTDGPLQLGPPGQASLYFNDPFGNHLELECMGFTRKIPVRPPSMASVAWPQDVRA